MLLIDLQSISPMPVVLTAGGRAPANPHGAMATNRPLPTTRSVPDLLPDQPRTNRTAAPHHAQGPAGG
jgi:hypothetical protein